LAAVPHKNGQPKSKVQASYDVEDAKRLVETAARYVFISSALPINTATRQ
jgi:hypothetical protein